MPWRARSLVEERRAFIDLVAAGETFAAACRAFGVSRQTGYKWYYRFERGDGNMAALQDLSRRPHTIRAVTTATREEVLRLRDQYGWRIARLTTALRAEGVQIGRTSVSTILKSSGRITPTDAGAPEWIHKLLVSSELPSDVPTFIRDPELLNRLSHKLRFGSSSDRKKAATILAQLKGIRIHIVAECLTITPHTIMRYENLFTTGGTDALFAGRKSKIDDSPHSSAVLSMLHSPPLAAGINRATWRMVDLQRVLCEKGHHLSEARIRRIIKNAGYKWRRARLVLTSNDPLYESKLRSYQADIGQTQARRGILLN
jgi:transposase